MGETVWTGGLIEVRFISVALNTLLFHMQSYNLSVFMNLKIKKLLKRQWKPERLIMVEEREQKLWTVQLCHFRTHSTRSVPHFSHSGAHRLRCTDPHTCTILSFTALVTKLQVENSNVRKDIILWLEITLMLQKNKTSNVDNCAFALL